MARAARGLVGGQVYHVLNRGNGRANVFHKAGDFAAFVNLLAEAKQRHPVKVLAYCLMTNHFHLLVQPVKLIKHKNQAAPAAPDFPLGFLNTQTPRPPQGRRGVLLSNFNSR